MKRNLQMALLLVSLFIISTAKATETEPNDTKAQANTLTLNGSNSGGIGAAADIDWWKITTTSDGKLDVTVTVSNGVYMWCQIYDNDGTTLLAQNNTNATITVTKDGLAAGTYYVKLYSYYNGQAPNYSISNALTLPTEANDVEPNDTRAAAKVLGPSATKTGHINYYYNGVYDAQDWYKITTTGDGQIKLTLTSGNGQYVWAYLYDNNGTTQLNAQNTNGTVDITTDGLAAGTYYVKIISYYSTGFEPYTIKSTFTAPAEANDAEPDSTRALALTLPLNSSTTGHINYYYNLHRDSADWYKVTTNADGRLRLRLTSGNGQYLWAYLYDNDGTTQLNAQNTNSTVDISTDGLAAGTYYIKIRSYYNTGWSPYTIADSLFVPTEANDAEPNDNRATALTLAINSTVTGHTDYYYNNKRDSSDWYKLTIPSDGMIHLNIASGNGQYIWAYLYDNDGTTQLNAQNTNTNVNINTDGLAAGTYYIKIRAYYSAGWAPYTLQNSLTTYTNANDGSAEPNDAAYQAKTLPSNQATNGHVNFYYNNTRNGVDWWKVNYTGTSGALSLVINDEAWKVDGTTPYYWVQVYGDTTLAPIYSSNFNTSTTINLTALTQRYYYIKIYPYYSTHFVSYSINPTFTQVTKAKVTLVAADTSDVCDSSNSITIKCTKSKAPYTAQLYRYNLPYRAAVTIKNTKNFTFTNLPKGNYYVRVYGDGATGAAFGRFPNIEMMPKPTGTLTNNIKGTQARLNWAALSCANYFSVQYRKTTDANWTTVNTNGNTTFRVINGLTVSTSYYWRVAAADSSNGVTGLSAYTDSLQFTTAASFASAQSLEDAISKTTLDNSTLLVYPNPVKSSFRIQFNAKTNAQLFATLRDINGNIVWSKNTTAQALSGTTVDAGKLTSGIYMLQITDANGNTITKKVVVSK